MNFIERKVSSKEAVSILRKSGIEIEHDEADIILEFLYLMAKNYCKSEEAENHYNLEEKSNSLKSI